jgi:hypothetical protein
MKLMSEKQQKKWEKTRAKGFDRFVFNRTLLCGIGIPILETFLDYIFDGKLNLQKFGWRVIGYTIAGLLGSWWIYEWNEYKYRKTAGKTG